MYPYFRSKKPKGLEQHPKLPFVYYYGNGQICIEHPNNTPMNRGAMRQHVEGKAHRKNYDTGESIMESELPKEIQKQIELLNKKTKKESKDINFDELKKQLDYIFDDPKDVKRILVKHVDEKIRTDVQNTLEAKRQASQIVTLYEIAKVLDEQRNYELAKATYYENLIHSGKSEPKSSLKNQKMSDFNTNLVHDSNLLTADIQPCQPKKIPTEKKNHFSKIIS